MDLIAGVGCVIEVMDDTSKADEPKVLQNCILPLTGPGLVDRIITNLSVLGTFPGRLRIVGVAGGATEDELRATTGATIV